MGGHYRVEERDLPPGPVSKTPTAEKRMGRACRLLLPPHALLGVHEPRSRKECQDCVVYRVRATWCFPPGQSSCAGTGHARRFCTGPCQDCPYYRRVHGLPTNVLVVTRDESLIQDLAKRESDSVAFRFARRGYDASAIISVFRPAFVVVDQAVLESLGVAPARCSGGRSAHVGRPHRRRDSQRARSIAAFTTSAVFATIEEPFSADEIVALIDRIPVETMPLRSRGRT